MNPYVYTHTRTRAHTHTEEPKVDKGWNLISCTYQYQICPSKEKEHSAISFNSYTHDAYVITQNPAVGQRQITTKLKSPIILIFEVCVYMSKYSNLTRIY